MTAVMPGFEAIRALPCHSARASHGRIFEGHVSRERTLSLRIVVGTGLLLALATWSNSARSRVEQPRHTVEMHEGAFEVRPSAPRVIAETDVSANRADEAGLLRWVATPGFRPVSAPELSRYDPPWTLPFVRRNEIWVTLEG